MWKHCSNIDYKYYENCIRIYAYRKIVKERGTVLYTKTMGDRNIYRSGI